MNDVFVKLPSKDGLEGYWIFDAYEEEYVYIPTAEELAW